MNTTVNSLIMRNNVFAWIALATGFILLISLSAMQFTTAVNWDVTDFIAMGSLLFGAGTVFVLVARKVPHEYRLAIGVVVVVAFLYAWAELAVGVFTNLGS